ncbi:arginine--tRNA ligase, partial [Candidatus Nomurabacteria bacterium]|nr:arginine--tRNA ligase [Candidatus Nomurabacteria bacterium]
GHVMNNAIGESIVRLAEFSGAETIKISFPSDVSLGIGKAVWALFNHGVKKIDEFKTDIEKLKFLGECYVEGTKAYDEDENVQKQVKKITEIIYNKVEGVEYDAYLKGKGITLDYFLKITKRLGSEFQDFIFESEAGEVGEKIVRENLKKVFETSDGAIIYNGEKEGLHTRVFINKEGYPTYEAKDIGLLDIKFRRFDPDISIVVTDHNQSEYYKVVLSAGGKINKNWNEKTIHRTHGRMSFKGKKMSSRLGGVPTAQEILENVGELVKERIEDKDDLEKIDMISISALKFTILKAMSGKNINFDPETSLSFEGDSGPYLAYTSARANSVVEKGIGQGMEIDNPKEKDRIISNVEKLIYRFEEIVELSIKEWTPHVIASYLLELAREYNSWYGETKIIDENNVNAGYNLAKTKAVSQIIKNGLYLLGIKTPERM